MVEKLVRADGRLTAVGENTLLSFAQRIVEGRLLMTGHTNYAALHEAMAAYLIEVKAGRKEV